MRVLDNEDECSRSAWLLLQTSDFSGRRKGCREEEREELEGGREEDREKGIDD